MPVRRCACCLAPPSHEKARTRWAAQLAALLALCFNFGTCWARCAWLWCCRCSLLGLLVWWPAFCGSGLLLVRSVRTRTARSAAVHMTRTLLTPVMRMNHEANRCKSLQIERATHTILAWASFRLLRLGVEGRCRQGRKPSERQQGSAICLYVLTVGTMPSVWVWATSAEGATDEWTASRLQKLGGPALVWLVTH